MRIPIIGPLLLVGGLVWAGPALGADDEEQARIQFERGIELYEAGQFEQAAIAFERAYELKPSYRLLFNLGQAEAEQGHFSRALTAYSRYLAEGGDAVPPERLTAVKAEIERLNALVGVLTLSCPVEGARVTVDGEPWGTTPITSPYLVDVGRHEVLVKHGQDELLRQVVRIAGGQRLELTVEAGEQGGGEPMPAPQPAATDEGPQRVWTWVALGVAAGAGIAGGAIGGVSMGKEKDLEADCQDGHCPPGSRDEADTIETMNLTADILYGVAGAAAITAIILFFVEPDDPAEPTVAVGPGPGPAGLALQGRF